MIKRILLFVFVVGFFFALGYLLWTTYGPGRSVYEIDLPGNAAACTGQTRFAIIGDYGQAGDPEADVAALVKAWQPDFIVTTGDNNYHDGAAATIDDNIGRYYSAYIHPYQGQFGPGSTENRFFPALGNHDWNAPDAQPYLGYFTLPGNERYYELRRGPVQLFILDSNTQEPDGRSATSLQAQWLAGAMGAGDAPWKIVVLHHPPQSSGAQHGSDPEMQWDFAALGADAVIAGHEHLYERIERGSVQYIINGLGGRRRIYPFTEPVHGSAVRYNQDYGAMLVTAAPECLNFSFYNRRHMLVDSHTLTIP